MDPEQHETDESPEPTAEGDVSESNLSQPQQSESPESPEDVDAASPATEIRDEAGVGDDNVAQHAASELDPIGSVPPGDVADDALIELASIASAQLGVPKVLFDTSGDVPHPAVDFVEPPAAPSTRDAQALNDPVEPTGEPVSIDLGPYDPDEASAGSPDELYPERQDSSGAGDGQEAAAELSPRTQDLLRPTFDGGPPLARPIVMVRLSDEQLRQLEDETLTASARRNAQTCREIAEERVNYAFWARDCEERAINGDW